MRTRSSRAGITRRKDREVILIGEERILDEGIAGCSETSADWRPNAVGHHLSDDDPAVGEELSAASGEATREPAAAPAADLVALVTSRWMEAEAKAQKRSEEGRRLQERELQDAKATLADGIETRHAASERELKAALAQVQERAGEFARHAGAEADRSAKRLADELSESGAALEQRINDAFAGHEAEADRNAKRLVDELSEREAAIEQRLEEASAGYAADLLERHDSLGDRIAEERSRSREDLGFRFYDWAGAAEERLDAAITNATRQASGVGKQRLAEADPEARPSPLNAPSQRSLIVGGLTLAAVAALVLQVGDSSEPVGAPEATPTAEERAVRTSKPRKATRLDTEKQPGRDKDQASREQWRSSGSHSEPEPVPEVEVAAPPPPPSADTSPAPAAPPPTEQPASVPAPIAASESEVQQEFGP